MNFKKSFVLVAALFGTQGTHLQAEDFNPGLFTGSGLRVSHNEAVNLALSHICSFFKTWNLDSKNKATIQSMGIINGLFKLFRARQVCLSSQINSGSIASDLPAFLTLPSDIRMIQHADKIAQLESKYGKGKKFILFALQAATLAIACLYLGSNGTSQNLVLYYGTLNWAHQTLLMNATNGRYYQATGADKQSAQSQKSDNDDDQGDDDDELEDDEYEELDSNDFDEDDFD